MASTYYQADNASKDPTNQWLWRFPVKRLEGGDHSGHHTIGQRSAEYAGGRPSVFPIRTEIGRCRRSDSRQVATDERGAVDLETQRLFL